MIKKILIANRGEIACRVIKTAKKMGIKTVAVYSEADEYSKHVLEADESILIGPPPSSESYLSIKKIIDATKKTNSDAIHPGYGFLSENSNFVQKLSKTKIKFIGPNIEAIKIMGDKIQSKNLAIKASVNTIPGFNEVIKDDAHALSIAEDVGFPLMIKASAGGGGKGMRIVKNKKEIKDAFQLASSEAKTSFGDARVFIEKYIEKPRHIEIQVLADQFGNVIHLGERECSIQRRHQKIIEEAPSSVISIKLRNEMGEQAKALAKEVSYQSVGTVEFIVDQKNNFYFLEMNTRLQVEHPVTELITGIDLVEQQIKVANGETLSFTQEDLKIDGHAVELRVYAEDPLNDFLPSVGNLEVYKLPEGNGIRVDNGFEEGMEVPIYYDPMLAKLITYGKTREAAIQLMVEGIDAYEVEGIQTTLPFGKFVFENDAFRSGNFNTHFVKNNYSPEKLKAQFTEEAELAAKVALRQYLKDSKQLRLPKS